jgi:ubiquinone/menaquinone biosynthesis C-methylase UbiE
MMQGAQTPRDWWRRHFDQAYWRLHDPLFPEALSRREVAGMIELLGLPVGSRILDAPCGWGRHTVLLGAAGYDVTGADLSPDLLMQAPAGMPPALAADIRSLPFDDATFDAVLNVFTSLGLFVDDAEDVRALSEARRVLVQGGVFLLESMHRDDIVVSYAERDAWTLPDGTEVRARRRFDPIAGVSHERIRWRRGRERGEKRHALRLRTATEIAALLKAAGFTEIEYYGDWDGSPFHHRAERLIALARNGRRP